MIKLKRNITQIIVHCSDSNRKAHDNIETIKKWHVEERGWSDIGYHFVITKDGTIHRGRPLERSGAHCAGRNGASIGICLTGKMKFSEAQYSALKGLVVSFQTTYNIPDNRVNGHNEFSSKTCPNFNVQEVLFGEEESCK